MVKSPVITRDDVERAIWYLTGWRGAPGAVDRLLTVVDEYALAHGAILPNTSYGTNGNRVVSKPPQAPAVFDRMLDEDKRIRCNRCGKFYPFDKMVPDHRRVDGVRTHCKECEEKGVPLNPQFRGQRVYRLRTLGGWEESRRMREV